MNKEDYEKAAATVFDTLITMSMTTRRAYRLELIGFLGEVRNMVTLAVEAIDCPNEEYYWHLGGKKSGKYADQYEADEEFWVGVKNTEDMCPEFECLNNKLVKAAKASMYPTDLVLKSFWRMVFEEMYEDIDDNIKMVEETWGAKDHETDD